MRTGSGNLVVMFPEVALRVSTTRKAAEQILRSQKLVDALPELPIALPRSAGEAVRDEELCVVPTVRLTGGPCLPGEGTAAELRRLLGALAEVSVDSLHPFLAEPHSFCGGRRWLDVVRHDVAPLLPHHLRDVALRLADDVEALPPAALGLVHGDLAGANVLWHDGRISAVLDWNLAACDDPADDLASLAAWHGWDMAKRAAPPEEVERATVLHRTYPLQLIAHALVEGRPADQVERAIEAAEPSLELARLAGPAPLPVPLKLPSDSSLPC